MFIFIISMNGYCRRAIFCCVSLILLKPPVPLIFQRIKGKTKIEKFLLFLRG